MAKAFQISLADKFVHFEVVQKYGSYKKFLRTLSLIETYTGSLQVHTTTNSEISYHQSTMHNRVDRLKERVYTILIFFFPL